MFGNSKAASEKVGKRIANQAFRSATRVKMSQESYDTLPIDLNEVYNVWSMEKDGKNYWAGAQRKDMRK